MRIITDEVLEVLGNYFIQYNIYEQYGVTFELFLNRWARGIIDI